MIGLVGRSEVAIDPVGRVFVHGESWKAISDQPIEAGESVEILSVEGLTVRVQRATPRKLV
jgi:membrane-bound serine protease (ClpP class)